VRPASDSGLVDLGLQGQITGATAKKERKKKRETGARLGGQ
jgi:hypothetical protein